jgi:chromodomain-helicase-DNA-binding protein 7
VEEELTKDCRSDEDLYTKLLESSGKLMLLDKFIEKFKKENHKMLIFSQFKKMLDIIELYLKMKAVPYEKLTGSVKNQDRVSAIQRFNDNKTVLPGQTAGGDNKFGVFLLTTRAGGLGINLTSARVVIIFDSDWNP